MWENLIQAIKAKLEANNEIAVTFDYEEGQFDQQPVAVVVPSDSDGEFTTSLDNERVYAFNIFLFVQRGESLYTDKKADQVLRSLVDSVIDDFDKDWNLSSVTMKTGYSMIMSEAAPSAWGYASREQVYRMAEITLRVHLSVDTNLIT